MFGEVYCLCRGRGVNSAAHLVGSGAVPQSFFTIIALGCVHPIICFVAVLGAKNRFVPQDQFKQGIFLRIFHRKYLIEIFTISTED